MKSCPQCNLRYPDESTFCFVDGTTLAPMADPRVGTTLAGRYVIESVIGEGGMATVYRARHKLVDRPCAVKIMNPALARDQVVRERFRREAKAAQKLAHPNIIEIFDHGDTEDGTSYLVMELLQGESLADLVAKGKIPLKRALPLMVQMARALARAHDFEVVHRDLKPENIFVGVAPDGGDVLKLLDFGIARSMQDSRLTGVGEVFGTPQYMAPERITSIDAGPPADLYAVGIIFFEMLTTQLPFDAPDIPSFFVKHMKEAPPKVRTLAPEVPVSLETLIDRLLAKDPKQRPVDAHSVNADLAAICREIGIPVPPEPQGTQPSSREPAPTLPPAALDRWVHRTIVFEQMLTRAFGAAAPVELVRLLAAVKDLVRQIAELRTTGVGEQRKLEAIEDREREGRQRFGFAMDALGVDMSAARQQARAAHEALGPLRAKTTSLGEAVLASTKEIIVWEGRSGFREPSKQLASAYRTAAELTDAWVAARAADRAAESVVDDKDRMVADLEFQIRELRGNLAKFEQSMESEKSAQQAKMTELGKHGDLLEGELVTLASRFCAPLRGNPDLSSFFKELEGGAAAALGPSGGQRRASTTTAAIVRATPTATIV
jgi:serine/threonine-protein kinase